MRIALAIAVLLLPRLAAAESTPARYLVCEIDRNDAITIVSSTDVMVAGELKPQTTGDVSIELLDASGRAVYRTAVKVDRYVRAEFHDGEGRWIERDRVAFVVRVPRLGESVELSAGSKSMRMAIDALPRNEVLTREVANAANRLDVLVMGDGYTSAQQSLFASHAATMMADFFDIPPYATYENYVNVTSHFVASQQSGADHPHCADGGADPLEGTFVATAFDATFCSFGIQRLLTVNDTKVFQAAAAVPDWDKILVIVNDSMYGGAGGPVGVFSINQWAVGIAQHEFGHSFTGLADEYTTAYPGFPACSDSSGSSPCEPNVTNVTARASVKWNAWIDPATPVPTTPQSSYPTVPGLFEGARYQTAGLYRPKYNCLMNVLEQPFCEVCSQSYILRLYNGWGGVPASGIDMIEPGSESPAPGATTATAGVAKTFTATILEPVGGPSAQKQWFVNGVQQASTTNTLHWTPSSGGTHTVELRVKDLTTLVKAAMAGTALTSSRTWTVDVAVAAPANFTATAGTSSVALSWSPVPGATSYEIARRTVSADQPPQFVSANGTTFAVGHAGSFTVMTSGLPAPSISLTNGTLPWGVLFADQGNGTALLSGTPAESTAGNYPLAFMAFNSSGSASQNFMLTVNESAAMTRPDSDFTTIATTSGTAATDTTVSPNTAYVYKVRAAGGAYSPQDLATVYTFTDDPLAAGVVVRALHLTQLRSAIDLARALSGLGAAVYTYTPAAGGIVRAVDITELRTALDAARTALGMPAASFTTPSLAGAPIRALHVTELRNAVR